MTELKRKGAKSIKDIPKDILEQLNRGEIETVNLMEWLAIDRRALLENLLKQHGREKYLKPVLEQIDRLEKQTAITVSMAVVTGLSEQITVNNDCEFLRTVSTHKSDLIRCFAACIVGKNAALDIKQTLREIEPFAADHHFNVRECAWSIVRQKITGNLEESVKILSGWAVSEDENIRRFASEATRPRGVSSEHIKELKQNPALALSIIEPLKSDKSRYVQDSVGNWLNDASKTQPEFVKELCKRWENESNTKETKYIIRKALRTIDKMA
ncbi:MAG: DNA alkylation repair protein [Prevotellaceae bacterium]|jgi:3-methyladenine DNA glycosylase AlkC|nr:DNA alkylation repair protein [Prevotellaceae bacterium]